MSACKISATGVAVALLLSFSMIPVRAQEQRAYAPLRWSGEELAWADSILATLALVDKVGEMTQMAIDVLSVGEPYKLEEPHRLDTDKMRQVLVDLRVGSILNAGGHAYSQEHWRMIQEAIQQMAVREKPSAIPVLYGIDAVHGTNYTSGATLFPQQLGQASTWNPALAGRCGEVTAYETRASGIPWTFSPVMDIGRDPRWPRLWETYGEDVLLASTMGQAYVEGLQGNDAGEPTRVAACLKHFLGYSMPWSGKDRTPAWLPERQLREYVLPPFRKAIESGAMTIMVCSGDINGIPVHVDQQILTGLLREELGFAGLAVTDWEDIGYLVTRHRVAANYKDAIAMAVNAGIDMAMVPMDTTFPILLRELAKEGRVPISRIDEAVRRILLVKRRLGLFDVPVHPVSLYPDFAQEPHRASALEAARESVILSKNERNVLPLSSRVRIMVAGPTAHSLNALNGGWTGTWQGRDTHYNTPGMPTLLEALRLEFGGSNIRHFDAMPGDADWSDAAFRRSAKHADIILLALGEMPYTEKPGDLDDMDLSAEQLALAKAASKLGKPVVVVLLEGRPRIVRDIEPVADAILVGFLPGDQGGRAIAEILSGRTNPSGRFPITYPRYGNDLLTYDHKWTERVDTVFGFNGYRPQWRFGHGLSYTDFRYDELRVEQVGMNQGDPFLKASVVVTNTGDRAGKEVVQLYVSDLVASITPSGERLRGFEKVLLQPGESRRVEFRLTSADLAFVGRDNRWVTEPGEFLFRIGTLSTMKEYPQAGHEGSR